ncbi:hypothetical protein Tco_1369556 [Tanacetum coccineum]
MTACLNDLNYIPLNNEQNEPTQGDIGETSNDLTQAKRNEFEELYASANEELYPGCDYVTRLDFMAKFTYFKVKGKLTDSIFNEMLEFFQNVFPTAKGYKLPPSYYAIKKTFKTIGLGYESIHACVNDCFLFRGDVNKDVHFCLVCNTSRWKDSNTPGKKVPKKVLRYFLIIPRLQRLYKSSHTAKEMTWHATGKCTEPDSSSVSQDTTFKAVVQPDLTNLPEISRKQSYDSDRKDCWNLDEMLRLQGLGSNTPTGVPYTEDEIIAIVCGGKQRGHIPGVRRMLNQLESQPEYGGGSESGWCGDDEPGDDEDGGEDEEDEDDS